MPNWLVALPVFNEVNHVQEVLDEVKHFADHILAVDDGSTDGTTDLLQQIDGITVLHHPQNSGYGAALISAFRYAIEQDYEALVTIDCDGQHQPKLIPEMVRELLKPESPQIDILSGSRYLQEFSGDVPAPEDRRRINFEITKQLNQDFNLNLTDSFCGLKAYRISALKQLNITDTGYAMPLQLWIQAARAGLRIEEFPVPRIYLDEVRSFGGSLDDAARRMAHYQQVIQAAMSAPFPEKTPLEKGESCHTSGCCSPSQNG